MKKVNVSPERRVHWDEEVLEMPKYDYLERTPKAERARGPFLEQTAHCHRSQIFDLSNTYWILRNNYLCSPPTYLHTHTRLRETKGAFGPNNSKII